MKRNPKPQRTVSRHSKHGKKKDMMNGDNPSLSPRRNEVADKTRYRVPPKRVLIFSSIEGKPVAEAVKTCIDRFSRGKIKATLWDRTNWAGWFLDHVLGQIRRFPFVVLILTPDQKIINRKETIFSPRDNLLMELGIALATNEHERTFVLRPESTPLKLPTNISGWNVWSYRESVEGNHKEAVREIITQITKHQSEMSWDLFLQQIEWLHERINQNPVYGNGIGFRPNIVVGVNMGGMLAGSLLYYKNRKGFHFMTVWTKDEFRYRKLAERQRDFQEELRQVVYKIREESNEPRILLIDDSDKSGEAMNKALELTRDVIKGIAPSSIVKTAALVYLGPPAGRPDYCEIFDYERFKYAPV